MASDRFGAYCRVSSEQQAKAETIQTQREEISTYSQIHQLPLYDFYPDDGVSGMLPFEERPEGRRLLEDARLGRICGVIVYKTARLGRDFLETCEVLKILRDAGLFVQSVTEKYDASTPDGRFMQGIHAIVAEKAREDIVQSSRDGSSRLARAGAWMGGQAPFGYRLSGTNKDCRLVIHEEEAAIVRQIYHWFVFDRLTCYAIGQRLTAMGVPITYVRDGRLYRGQPPVGGWAPTRIRTLIAKQTYKGVNVYGKKSKVREPIVRTVPAIVEPETWDAAQRLLKENLKFSPRHMKKHHYLLSGLMRCGICGKKYVGRQTSPKRNPYYLCGWKHMGHCHAPNLDAPMVEGVIWEQVHQFLSEPDQAVQLLEEVVGTRRGELEGIRAMIAGLTQQIQKKTAARQGVIQLYEEEMITKEDLSIRLATLTTEVEAMQEQEAGLRAQVSGLQDIHSQLQEAEVFLKSLGGPLPLDLGWEQKRDMLRRLVLEVVVDAQESDAGLTPHVRATFLFTNRVGSRSISKLTLALCLDGLPLAA